MNIPSTPSMSDEGSDPEVLALEGLSEPPVLRRGAPGGGGAAVAAGDAEGEGLADEDGAGLPVLAPVPGHGHPPGAGRLDAGADQVPGAGHVGDEHQVEVAEAVDGEGNLIIPQCPNIALHNLYFL